MIAGMLIVALAAITTSVEHAYVRPMPGSRVVADDERDGELVVTYRDAGSRVRKTIEGKVYSIEYEISDDVSAEDVVEFFTLQAEGLDGGDVHRTTENRLTFSFRRPEGGTTWCEVWATDGNYTLELVDERPDSIATEPEPEPEPEPYSGIEAATLLFDETTDALPPGSGAVLDDVATRLNHQPTTRLEIRARGNRGRRNAETVRSALLLFGIAGERLTIASVESDDDANRVELVLLP